MKNKNIIALFVLGSIITVTGALLKIIHFETGFITGNLILSIGLGMEIFAVIFLIIKLFKNKNTSEFLNK